MNMKIGIKYNVWNIVAWSTLWFLFAFNHMNRDRAVYELLYKGGYDYHEPFFVLLCGIFREIGFSYQEFLMVLATICILLIYSFVRKITQYSWLFIFLVIIYPFPLLITVLRNTIAFSLILFGLPYLLEYSRKGVYKYIGIVLLATGFHYSAILYLLFLGARIKNKNKVLVLSIGAAALGVTLNYTNLLPELISIVSDSPKMLGWFENRTKGGLVLSVFLQLYSWFVFLYSYKKLESAYGGNVDKHKKYNLIYKLNAVSFLFICLYVFSTQFLGRCYLVIILINYTLIVETIKSKEIRWEKCEKLLYNLLVVIQLGLFTFGLYMGDYIELFGYIFSAIF